MALPHQELTQARSTPLQLAHGRARQPLAAALQAERDHRADVLTDDDRESELGCVHAWIFGQGLPEPDDAALLGDSEPDDAVERLAGEVLRESGDQSRSRPRDSMDDAPGD